MVAQKSILEVRRHPLMSAILISISLSLIYTLRLAFAPYSQFESIVAPALLGGGIDTWQSEHPVWAYIIVGVSVALLSIKLSQLVSRFNLYGSTTHLPMELLPLLLMGLMLTTASLRMTLVATLIAYSISRFFRSYRAANSSSTLISGAMALGVVTLLYPPTIALWVVVPFMLVTFERTTREVIVTWVGVLLPPFTYLYIKWLMGAEFGAEAARYWSMIASQSGYSVLDSFDGVVIVTFALVLYVTINSIFAISMLDNTVKGRRRLKLLALYGVAAIAMLLIPSSDTSTFSLIAIPLAMLTPVAMVNFGRLMSFIIYVALFICAAAAMCGL